jgi:RNA polymerase sigma-70 factor (ECF subfamily)
MEHPDSEPLLGGLAAGDARAFGVLYDRFAGRLYQVAMSMLYRREDAEDAVQEVFVALVRSRRRLGAVRDLQAYLFAALRRAAARCAARRARLPPISETAVHETAAPSGQEGESSLREDLAAALRALPAEQRDVIALKIDGELTFAQIGQVMGTSGNTAASRYRYALEKLRELLDEKCP